MKSTYFKNIFMICMLSVTFIVSKINNTYADDNVLEGRYGDVKYCFYYDQGLMEIKTTGSTGKLVDDFIHLASFWGHEDFNNLVKKIKFDEGTTYIGNDAFFNCDSLEEVIIPENITGIGRYAFMDCDSLKKITIPGNLKKITNGCFSDCRSLKEINISYGVEGLSGCVFAGCTSLKEINIPSSVVELGNFVFKGCTKLEDIEIPNSVNIIGEGAFCECTSLKKINIPSSVIEIGGSAFSRCSSLEKVIFSDKLNTIGSSSFQECNLLKDISLPETLTDIGDKAFYACDNIERIVIPKNVKSIGEAAFADCTKLYSIEFLTNKNVNFGWSVFSGCISLKNINIPEGITKIGIRMFHNCSELSEVELPNSLEKIETGAFENCINIKEITIPGSVNFISSGSFRNCTNLKTINLYSNTIEKIEKNAIENQSKEDIYIHCGDNKIFKSIIQNISVKNVYLKEGWQEIAGETFSLAYGIKRLYIPSTVTYIYDGAIYWGIKIVARKDSCAYEYAMNNKNSFEDVDKSSAIIKKESKTNNIKKSAIEEKNAQSDEKSIDDGIVIDRKTNAKYKILVNGTDDSMGTVEFICLTSSICKKFIIPRTITYKGTTYKVVSIANNAFIKCKNLKKVIISEDIKKIGKKAFFGCKKLKTIIIKTKKLKKKSIGAKAFKGINKKAKFKVPKKKLKLYKKLIKKAKAPKKCKITK